MKQREDTCTKSYLSKEAWNPKQDREGKSKDKEPMTAWEQRRPNAFLSDILGKDGTVSKWKREPENMLKRKDAPSDFLECEAVPDWLWTQRSSE